MLKIFLLGSFQITLNDEPVAENAWHTKQARQLLKILLTHRGRIVPRDVLIDALWSDADPAKAATTLRTAINALRKTLEPNRPRYTPSSFIVAHAPGYKFQLSASVWVDAIAFEKRLDHAVQIEDKAEKIEILQSALNLYQDDYLFDDLYAEWSIAERERLRERYLAALTDLAECHVAQGDIDRAIADLRRVLMRDPGQEPVYRTLMRYYMQQGDMVSALKIFEQLRQYLLTELGADPSPQTLALHQSVLNGQWRESLPHLYGDEKPSELEDVFVGRVTELESLLFSHANLEHSQGDIICLAGESGVGKTKLASVLLARATQLHTYNLSARCQAVAQALPFAPIIEAIEYYAAQYQPNLLKQLSVSDKAHLAHLFPTLTWQVEKNLTLPSSEINRQWVVTSLLKILLNLAQQPLILFLDDAQWIDEATLMLLASLKRYLPKTKILILLAYRAEELAQNEALTQFVQTAHAKIIELNRFSETETRQLLQKIVPNWDDDTADAQTLASVLHPLTGGNPLFIVETLRSLLDAHPDSLVAGALKIQPSRPVTDIILSRLAQLSPDARLVLEMGAVIGRDFSTDLLETLATSDPLPALSMVLHRQFLTEVSPGRLDFSHQLVREVIYRQLSPLARQRLHRRVAQALISLFGRHAGVRSAEIADHSEQAGTSARGQSIIFSVLAGDYALRVYGFEQAVHRYRHSLSYIDRLPDEPMMAEWIQRAYRGLGMAQESLMAWDSARETYRQCRRWAQKRGDKNTALMAQYRLASMLGLLGQLSESAALTAQISRDLPPDAPQVVVDGQQRLQLLSLVKATPPTWTSVGFPVFQPHPIESKSPWIEIAKFLGEEQAAQTLNLYGWALTLQGQSVAAEATLNYAAQLADTFNQPGLRATSFHLLAQLWDLRGEYGLMTQSLSQALALVADIPHLRWIVIWGRIHQAYVDFRWNQLERATTRLHRLDAELKDRAVLRSHWLSVQVGLGLLAMYRNNSVDALAHFEIALENSENLYASNYVALYLSRARLYRHQDNLDAAQRDIVQAMAFAAERGMLADYISGLVEAARFAQKTNQPDDVLDLLQQAENFASRAELLPARLSVRLALAKIYRQLGQLTDATWFYRMARADRDSIAATIVDKSDRAAYLSRYDLRRL